MLESNSFIVNPISWAAPEADEARRIRMEVFVGEQGVPGELELDEIDHRAFHVLARKAGTGEACGTGRLFSDENEPGVAHIGRMAVLASARGTGCGSAILAGLLNEARTQGFDEVVLSAQTHAMPFYSRHGFAPEGPTYDDCGIPHQRMRQKL